MHVIYTICAMPFSYLYNGENNKKNSPVSIFRVIAETSSKIHLSSLAIKLFFSNNSQYYEYHVINLFFLFLMFTVIHNGLFLVNDMHTVLHLLKSGQIEFLVQKDAQCFETYLKQFADLFKFFRSTKR